MHRLILALAPSLVLAAASHAQEWSAQQQEVWSHVETYWDLYAKEDVDGFLAYLHEDFRGWTYGAPLPRDKAYMESNMPQGFATSETILYDIKPVAIQVQGQVAVVHYYYERTYMNASGEQLRDSGRWTDVLLRQDDRWIMIADHGGSGSGI
jgi:ketosteroid isomerase-like protein